MPLMKDPTKIERNCRRIYGCSLDLAISLNGDLPLRTIDSPAWRYTHQKRGARSRGIEWSITFSEWIGVWLESGKWNQRGHGAHGYVMGRNGDSGPYAIGNVYICTNSQNVKDAHANKVLHVLVRKDPALIRGYSIDKTCSTPTYRVKVAGKRIGTFRTAEEATAAYWSAVAAR